MSHRLNPLAAAAVAALLLPLAPAGAATFGSLANFDVVNDTGHTAYGFEIEIEDSLYDHAGTISSVFGYDRVFSFISNDPGAVVRYGKPTIEYIAGFGARITYGGSFGANFTPSAPFATGGESCWPGANTNWRATSCDHFGVSTYGSPAKTTYRWLLDDGSGSLVKQVVGVPAVNIVYTPPAAPNLPPPAPPVIQLQAQDLGQGADNVQHNQNNAFWVKIIKTELSDNVHLNDLLGGNHPGARPEIAGLDGETEIEWQPLQLGMVDEVTKSLDSPKPSVVYKFQFFDYLGRFDDDGYVDPQSGKKPGQENQMPQIDGDGQAFVMIGGQRRNLSFVGQQIAGFNANEVAPPPVPEPQTWALMLAGLLGLVWRGRLSRPPATAR
ncbi:MAG: PEP-CTERM sorting domain-containing protein [Burkholderiales bacterium]|nr:PEP-CTERM sorting domain-containing protein [Burkholderiales bacterium]